MYSRTERERATQIAARSTAPFSWETPPPPPPPVSRTLRERTFSSSCWSISKGGSWELLYETHPWLFTLFSMKLHQEKVWDADGNWQWHFLIFLGPHSGSPSDLITSTGIYSLIFWHTETDEMEQRYFIQASSSNIGAISKKSGLLDSLLRNNTPR